MSGFSYVADTNFLFNVHEGRENVEPFLEGSAIVSYIRNRIVRLAQIKGIRKNKVTTIVS